MLLALDIGNTHIFGGVFDNDKLIFKFRKTSKGYLSSDEFGVFFRNVLKENEISHKKISNIAICSVVPDIIYPVHQSSIKYFNTEPFMIQSGVRTGLNIKYKNPQEVGTDRIANAIAGVHLFPDKNIIIVDLGTATTFCAVTKLKEYLGGIILPGVKISMEALSNETAKLSKVEIAKPQELVGKSTVESIQAGLYFGNLFAIREIVAKIKTDYFNSMETMVLGTGGFSKLFEDAGIFDKVIPDLVLIGINLAFKMNNDEDNKKIRNKVIRK